MKRFGFLAAAGAALFLAGYFSRGYVDRSSLSLQKDNAAPSAGKAEDERAGSLSAERSGDAAGPPAKRPVAGSEGAGVKGSGQAEEQAVQAAASDQADRQQDDALNASGQNREALREQMAAGLRAGGVPEEDIENIVNSMTVSAKEMGGGRQAVPAEEPKSADAIRGQIVAGLKAGGVPEEDIEGIADAMAPASKKSAADDPQAKTELADRLREGGMPEEDIAAMTENREQDGSGGEESQRPGN